MKRIRCYVMVIALISLCCSGRTIFVVYRDVPTNPSYVVVPVTEYLYEVEFANKIESYIIDCGLRTVRRPGSKVVETKKQISQAQVESKEGKVAEATLTERYYSLEETNADYIVESYADTKQLKIIKKETKEIIAAFQLTGKDDCSMECDAQLIYDTLKSIGMPVREKAK